MKAVYPVFFTFTEDEKDTVLIEVPDMEILTEGYGFYDAIEMARDAMNGICVSNEDMNLEVKKPTDVSEMTVESASFKESGKTIISLVDMDSDAYRRKTEKKMVRRNVTIPSWLDYEAKQKKINVSRVLQEALIEKLEIEVV